MYDGLVSFGNVPEIELKVLLYKATSSKLSQLIGQQCLCWFIGKIMTSELT